MKRDINGVVAFIVRYPRLIKPASESDAIINNVDFAPTILDLAGQPTPSGMQGRSFLPILTGKTPSDWPQSTYYRYWMHMAHHDNPAHYGLRTERYKLIFFYGQPLDDTDETYPELMTVRRQSWD
jgi:arylsulfatase A-like enzyme